MEFSQEPIPAKRSEWSKERHGSDTPFRHHAVVQQYLEDLLSRNEYQKLIRYNTTVERARKNERWELVLRTEVGHQDYWWKDEFDAIIDASGHYSVPFIPYISGLKEFAEAFPGRVEHTKSFRGADAYRGKVGPTTPF